MADSLIAKLAALRACAVQSLQTCTSCDESDTADCSACIAARGCLLLLDVAQAAHKWSNCLDHDDELLRALDAAKRGLPGPMGDG